MRLMVVCMKCERPCAFLLTTTLTIPNPSYNLLIRNLYKHEQTNFRQFLSQYVSLQKFR